MVSMGDQVVIRSLTSDRKSNNTNLGTFPQYTPQVLRCKDIYPCLVYSYSHKFLRSDMFYSRKNYFLYLFCIFCYDCFSFDLLINRKEYKVNLVQEVPCF